MELIRALDSLEVTPVAYPRRLFLWFMCVSCRRRRRL